MSDRGKFMPTIRLQLTSRLDEHQIKPERLRCPLVERLYRLWQYKES